MNNPIAIPFLLPTDQATVGGPATASQKAARLLATSIHDALIDEDSLASCFDAVASIVATANRRLSTTPQIGIDRVAFELGVSSTGKVGFVGVGLEAQAATKFQIALQIKPS